MEHSAPLSQRHCIPCQGGVPPLTAEEQAPLARQIPGWATEGGHHLRRVLAFQDFATALAFVVRVGGVAETENHHPDIALSWGRVEITVWTHKIDGLTESDFVLAAKVDALLVDTPGRVGA